MFPRLSMLSCATVAALAACSPLVPHSEAAPSRYEADPALRVPSQPEGDRFALEVFRELVAESPGNITFSPASLEAVLHLLREGTAGNTRAALEALPLGKPGVERAMQVQAAQALFVAEDLRLRKEPASVQRVPFAENPAAALKAINTWSARQTQGLVPEIASAADIARDTRLVALSAVYLREKWLRPFDAACTWEEGSFTGPGGRQLTVPLMYQCEYFRYAEGEDWQAIALFYRRDGRAGEPGCFIGILPKGDARSFACRMSPERFEAIRHALATSRRQEVRVTLPRMKIDSGCCSLKSALLKRGLEPLFGLQADFSGFCEEDIYLSNILQRCHVIVSEKETEAAAVTMGAMKTSSALAPRPKEISFTHPFIWAIGDLCSAAPPLFMGLCESPQDVAR